MFCFKAISCQNITEKKHFLPAANNLAWWYIWTELVNLILFEEPNKLIGLISKDDAISNTNNTNYLNRQL